jgi:hypothetical protein
MNPSQWEEYLEQVESIIHIEAMCANTATYNNLSTDG